MSEDAAEGATKPEINQLTAICIESDSIAIPGLKAAAERVGIRAIFYVSTEGITPDRFDAMPNFVICSHKSAGEANIAWMEEMGLMAEKEIDTAQKPLLVIASKRSFEEKENRSRLDDLAKRIVERIKKGDLSEKEAFSILSRLKHCMEEATAPKELAGIRKEAEDHLRKITASKDAKKLWGYLHKYSDKEYSGPAGVIDAIECFVRERKPNENTDPLLALKGLKDIAARIEQKREIFTELIEANLGEGVAEILSAEIDNLIRKTEIEHAFEVLLDLITVKQAGDRIAFTSTSSPEALAEGLGEVVGKYRAERRAMIAKAGGVAAKEEVIEPEAGEKIMRQAKATADREARGETQKKVPKSTANTGLGIEIIPETVGPEAVEVKKEFGAVDYD
jgi:hypothetical protein